MANTGKKRASSGGASSSSSKKVKLANKQASSKHKGKAPSSSASARSKQKSVDDYSTFGRDNSSKKSNGRGPAHSKSKSKDGDDAPKLLRDKKGKATIKEFVELPDHLKNVALKKRWRNEDSESDDESDSDDDDDEQDLEQLGVQDMLAEDDSDEEDDDENQAGPSSKQDFAKRAQFLSKLDMKELAR